MTTLACLLTACTNPALLAQSHLAELQGSADAGMVYVGASCCRQDGAKEARVATLWVARCPSPPLPSMLHAACGVPRCCAKRLGEAGRTVHASACMQISVPADLASVPSLPVPQPATKCMGSTLGYHWPLGAKQLLEGPAGRQGRPAACQAFSAVLHLAPCTSEPPLGLEGAFRWYE